MWAEEVASIGEIWGIGCRDQGLLSPPSTGRHWLQSVCSLLAAVISCHQQTSWWKGQGETQQSPCFISLFCPWGQESPKHPPPFPMEIMGNSTSLPQMSLRSDSGLPTTGGFCRMVLGSQIPMTTTAFNKLQMPETSLWSFP